MKTSIFAILLVVAGAFAGPTKEFATREERLVSGSIIDAINQVSQGIKDAGLDPLVIDNFSYTHVFVPLVAEVTAFVDQLEFTGLSGINVINVDYSVLLSRLRFDLALTEISLSVGNSGINANVFGTRHDANFSGSIVTSQIRFSGEARVNVGIISGISIRSLSVEFSLGGINSNLSVVVLGIDFSDDVNNVFNVVIPETILLYKDDINKYFTDALLSLLESVL